MLSTRKLTDRQLFWFGGSLSGMIFAFAMLALFRWESQSWAVILSGAALSLGGLFYGIPEYRRPIYEAFLKLTYPIQWVVTTVLLGIVYFGVLTPIAGLLRLRRYDPLERHGVPPDDGSYWKQRDAPASSNSYFKTY